MFIYIVTNRINGKVYVGQTNGSVERRWSDHRKSAQAGRTVFAKAIRKYGHEAFGISSVKLPAGSSQMNLNEAERLYIAELGSLVPNGYNLRSGGDGGGLLSETTRSRMSLGWHSTHRGQPHTAEAREKMSASRKGKCSPALRSFLAEANARRTFSAETRAKISAAKTGAICSPEVRSKISAALSGRSLSLDTRAKMSAVRKGRYFGAAKRIRRHGTPQRT